jgi:UDP-N-acetylglucosamine acyltransferase
MIDPRAIIDPKARVAEDVTIGPYSIIGADVEIGSGCHIGPHVVIRGPTTLGRNNRVFQFASLGDAPQDKKYRDEPTRLVIGDDNTIREYVSINRGTIQDQGLTQVGNRNWIMAYVHIAHDCVLGDDIIMANNAGLAGHVRIDDFVIMGGYSMVHQFCKIGAHAFVQFATGVTRDVPPYVLAGERVACPRGLNLEGLRRRGFTAEQISRLKKAYKLLYRESLTLEEAREKITEIGRDHPEIDVLAKFLVDNPRSIIR